MRLPTVFAALVSTLCLAPSARAQAPSIDARTFQPSTDPAASLSLEPVAVAAKGTFSLGAFTHYSHRPVTVRRSDTGDVVSRPVEHLLGGDFVSGLGLGTSSLGIAVPYVAVQTGDTGLDRRISESGRAPLAAIGDVAVEAKAPFVSYDTAGFALGMKTRFTLPTGDRASFAGAGTTKVELRLLAEYNLVVASAHGSLGYAGRLDEVRFPAGTGPTIGDELPFAAGLRVRPKLIGIDPDDRQLLEVAVRGAVPLHPVGPFGSGEAGSASLTPVLLGFSDRIGFAETKDVFLLAGIDVGLTSALGVPTVRGIVALGWSPRENDMDHDGVRDDRDQCPEIAEDRDGFEDDDGCPEIDDDNDGVLDTVDACPREEGVEQPGPRNGCPAPDADKDGVADAQDACPREAGSDNADARLRGCPARDRDRDGIDDLVDKCPDVAEDKDGHADEDGCPDNDDDADGVPDGADACPKERGEPSADPTRSGCPIRDSDGDTFPDEADRCPSEAETFNGVEDDDGCPEAGPARGAPLVRVDGTPAKSTVRLARPLKFVGASPSELALDASSRTTLRALAVLLNGRRDAIMTVGARPTSPKDEEAAAARAALVVREVRGFALRHDVAETVAWDSVKGEPGAAASGIGLGLIKLPKP